jgi:hypothetical protein
MNEEESMIEPLRFFAVVAALVLMTCATSFAQPGPDAPPAADPSASDGEEPETPPLPDAAAPAATAPAATDGPGASAATPAADGGNAAMPRSGDAQYEGRLREIEERVVGIKERIFQTKTRLLLLKEQILDNVIAESRAVLAHKNDMGSFFVLESVLYYLDGKKIYYQDNANGLLQKRNEFEIYNGSIIPGNHTLNVELVYRGASNVFTYLKGYVFKLKSSYTFYAAKGRVTAVSVVGFERGGIGTDLEDKPYIKYEVKQDQNRAKSKPAAAKK